MAQTQYHAAQPDKTTLKSRHFDPKTKVDLHLADEKKPKHRTRPPPTLFSTF